MATSVTVTRTNNAEIDGMLGGTKWTGAITYSFPDSSGDYLSGYSTRREPTTGFSQAPAAEQFAINYAVGLILDYTNASIQYAGTNSADIQIARSSAANPTSYAYYPSTSVTGTGGDVWFGTAYDYTLAKLGNYYFATALHELGHSLGLKHSQELGGVANVAVPAAHDDSEFTIMSYRSYVGAPLSGYTAEAYGFSQTYMANDILALQTLYGANFSSHSENTTYSWNPNTGREFINGVAQPAPGEGVGGSANRVFMTVWDGSGNDTYDLSNYTTAVTINLNPGASSITSTTQLAYLGAGHYARGNIFNAYLYNGDARSYIDNAFGGSGDDSITGNPVANYLGGGVGNDTLNGARGDDVLVGGPGIDTAVFSGSRANYLVLYSSETQNFTTVDLRSGSPDGTDTINGVENFQFADGLVANSVLAAAALDRAPVLTVADVSARAGQSLQAASLISATDADNDALTYNFYDNTPAANSGHFVVNGTVMPAGTTLGLTAAQLAQTVFVAGASGTSDDIYVQVSDGTAVSSLREFHVNVAVNHAPVLTVANLSAVAGQSLQAAGLIGVTDADDDALIYNFYDNTPAADSGHFVVNGTVMPAETTFGLTAAQLAQTVFVAGAAGVSDDIYVQISDGQAVSSLGNFHVNNPNHAPVLTVADVSAVAGQSLQVSGLIVATDADNDALLYTLFDNSPAANSGHFVFNGTVMPAGTTFGLTAAQLAQTVFVAGAAGVSDDIYVQVSDGQVVSSLGNFHVNVVNHAPVLTVADVTASHGQSLQASSLFSATDADNDTLRYALYDNTPAAESGHFVVNGTEMPAGATFGLTAAELGQTVFVAGAAGVSDDIYVQVSDGNAVSSLGNFHINAAVNHAPVLTVADVSGNAGLSAQVSNLFSVTDADNDTLTYYFNDNTPAANSGHFEVNGTAMPAGTTFTVSAAQLAQTVFVIGAAGTSDDLSVQVSDGLALSDLGEFHLTAVAPVLANKPVPGETPAEDPDTFPGMVGENVQFGASENSAFVFPPSLGSDHANDHIDVSVPDLNRDFAAAVVGSGDGGSAVIHLDLFGHAIALHDIHPATLTADYFMV